ncbi:MAG: M48 family metalloprotease [Clostridia bacterium]|nr:M48 family metalloprotease [Clostridia bacterium]
MDKKKRRLDTAIILIIVLTFTALFAVGETESHLDGAHKIPDGIAIPAGSGLVAAASVTVLILADIRGKKFGPAGADGKKDPPSLLPRKILIPAAGIALGVAGVLTGTSPAGAYFPGKAGVLLLSLSAGIAVALPFFQFAAGTRGSKKLSGMNVGQSQEFMLSQRKDAAETAKRKKRLCIAIRTLSYAAAAVYALCAACVAVCGGHVFLSGGRLLAGAAAALLFTAALFQIPLRRTKTSKQGDEGVLDEASFPVLYATARRAAGKTGFRGKFRIAVDEMSNSTAMVIRNGKDCLVVLSSRLLGILSEDEIYTVFLHEFGHMGAENDAENSISAYQSFISSGRYSGALSGAVGLFYSFLDFEHFLQSFLFGFANTVSAEQKADEKMAELPEAAASSLLKIQYLSLYGWEDFDNDDTPSFYASEKPFDGWTASTLADFAEKTAERSGAWNELTKAEIMSRSATHPTVFSRIEKLGVDWPPALLGGPSGKYAEEVGRALASAEETSRGLVEADYGKLRKENYLDKIEMIDGWAAEGRPLSPEKYGDLLDAMLSVGKTKEAEELANRAIDGLPASASHRGYYIRGIIKLHRYDDSGIDDIYTAMAENSNYIEEGLDVIGAYCCMKGLEKELNEYREKAVEIMQKKADENDNIGTLEKNDRLSEEHLPDGMLDEILGFIKNIPDNSVSKIFLVRKTVSDTFFTSAFVIKFASGTDDETAQRVMHAIFVHLDTCSDWQFSLFDHRELEPGTVERISGSLVWNADSATEG